MKDNYAMIRNKRSRGNIAHLSNNSHKSNQIAITVSKSIILTTRYSICGPIFSTESWFDQTLICTTRAYTCMCVHLQKVLTWWFCVCYGFFFQIILCNLVNHRHSLSVTLSKQGDGVGYVSLITFFNIWCLQIQIHTLGKG